MSDPILNIEIEKIDLFKQRAEEIANLHRQKAKKEMQLAQKCKCNGLATEEKQHRENMIKALVLARSFDQAINVFKKHSDKVVQLESVANLVNQTQKKKKLKTKKASNEANLKKRLKKTSAT